MQAAQARPGIPHRAGAAIAGRRQRMAPGRAGPIRPATSRRAKARSRPVGYVARCKAATTETTRSWTSTRQRSKSTASPRARACHHRGRDRQQVDPDPRAGPEHAGRGQVAVVHRLGEAARTIEERRRRATTARPPAYPSVAHRLHREVISGPARGGPGDRQRLRRLRGTAGLLEAPCPACAGERAARGRRETGSAQAEAPDPAPGHARAAW